MLPGAGSVLLRAVDVGAVLLCHQERDASGKAHGTGHVLRGGMCEACVRNVG